MDDGVDCVFCEIISGKKPADVIVDTERFLCFLDRYPVTKGHALVVPKNHIQHFKEIERPEIFSFLQDC